MLKRNNLELRIPPVLVTLMVAFFMKLAANLFPEVSIVVGFSDPVSWVLLGVGALVSLVGVVAFKSAKTSVNPIKPDGNSKLVTSGIYRISRNPMYLGFLIALIGIAVYLTNLFSLLLCGVFVMYMNRFQIRPEERALKSLFGKEYINYKIRTRRWL